MNRLTALDWERLEELERSWDPRLGGSETRPYRDLICYCAGRMLASGASFDELLSYMRASMAEACKLINATPAGAS